MKFPTTAEQNMLSLQPNINRIKAMEYKEIDIYKNG